MLVLAAAPPHTFSLPISLNSLDHEGVILLSHRYFQIGAGADDTSAGGATEIKWELDDDLDHCYVCFLDDQ